MPEGVRARRAVLGAPSGGGGARGTNGDRLGGEQQEGQQQQWNDGGAPRARGEGVASPRVRLDRTAPRPTGQPRGQRLGGPAGEDRFFGRRVHDDRAHAPAGTKEEPYTAVGRRGHRAALHGAARAGRALERLYTIGETESAGGHGIDGSADVARGGAE